MSALLPALFLAQPADSSVAHTATEEITVRLKTDAGHRFLATAIVPKAPGNFPLILFSHGNFASPDRYRQMLHPISAAGYIVLAPTHLDAEILNLRPKPGPEKVWATRNIEFAFLASRPAPVLVALERYGVKIDRDKIGVMGHSYGALIAQLAAGAMATEPDGTQKQRKITGTDALVAWSPPGPLKGRIDAAGWSHIDTPSLTITGTADILPGFIDDWTLHKISHDATPKGKRWLWVGEDVDHYFDGKFGRPGPNRAMISRRFDHALETTIAFLDDHLKSPKTGNFPAPLEGVSVTKD